MHLWSESSLTLEDWNVFAEYGRTMLSLQEFELALLGPVAIPPPDFTTLPDEERREKKEEFNRELERMFRMTAGQIKAKIATEYEVPEELLKEITVVVKWRDYLAHYFLRRYMDVLNIPSLVRGQPSIAPTAENAIAQLRELRQYIEAVTERFLGWWEEQSTIE